MSGYKIKFNGVDKIYDEFSWRITRRAKSVWRSGLHINSRHSEGSVLDTFEKNMAKYTKRKYAVAVGSGTDALYFALKAKGIGPGMSVLCPAISYMATAEAIKRTGADIRFVDVNDDGLIDDWGIMGLPSALVYVNLFGNLADYKRLKNYCDAYRIPLIEDAAQSLGSSYDGIPSGKLGDISSLSFAPSKPLPCFGNGGMVLTDDQSEAEKLRGMRYHGVGTTLQHGYNSCLSNDHANILDFLLSKYSKLLDRTSKIRKQYDEGLHELGIKSIKTQDKTLSNNHKLVIKVRDRDGLRAHLGKKGVETQVHYFTPLSEMDMFKNEDHTPNAKRFCQQVLSLPIHPFLTKDDVKFVLDSRGEVQGI